MNIYRFQILLCIAISVTFAKNSTNGVDFWHNIISKEELSISDLDREHLRAFLENSPNVKNRVSSDVVLDIPSYNGKKIPFRFFETNVLPPSLKTKYSHIKSYMGIGIDNPSHRSSLVLYRDGLYGLMMSKTGNNYIKVGENQKVIISKNDYSPSSSLNTKCEMNTQNTSSRDLNEDIFWDCIGTDAPCYPVGSTLTTYRFAGILSERANNEVSGGTVEGGLAWMVAMVNQMNLLWVRELGFRLEMVEGSDQLIFTDSNPAPAVFQQDPSCHSSGDPKYCELGEVKPFLESVIGPGGDDTPLEERTWEYGAHFDTRYNGGVAYMPGSTSTNNPDYEVFNHELGHNLGSPHNISIEGGWRCTIGGTIMGSRVRTLNSFSGDQYSSHSIELAMNYRNNPMIYQSLGIWGGDYVTGLNSEETGNLIPEVMVPEGDFFIPKETPFVLEGNSMPMHPEYTFSWEQNDASDESFSMNPLDNSLPFFLPDKGPLFSTVDPTLHGYKRYFPDMESLINNAYATEINDYGTMLTVEKLPFASREINMRLIVRTNDPYAGSLNHKNLKFYVDGDAGPFRVTSQADSTIWAVGSEQTITWDLANTNDANGVNCQAVDLALSLNGGNSFDFILAENVPNTGSHMFTVPPIPPVVYGRLMVKASDNVFFDINNGTITILNNNVPSLVVSEPVMNISLGGGEMETFTAEVMNDGEEGSVVSFITFPGQELFSNESFSDGTLPDGWSSTTNAECDNPGWYVTEDASSSYFTIPTGDGFYIATNDDACGGSSDGSNDMLYTNEISLLEGMVELSFRRFFTAGFSQTFHIYVSRDNWETYDEVLNLGYWEGNDEWVKETIDLQAYAGESVALAFHSNDNGNWASGAALDDIQLGMTPLWIFSSSTGTIQHQGVETFEFSISTEGLSDGNYSASVVVEDVYQSLSDTLEVNLNVNGALGTKTDVIPDEFVLHQNYPNPFNPSTDIQFSLPSTERVHLIVYDLIGNTVKEIVNNNLLPGIYNYKWSGENEQGSTVSAGMYFYRIQAGSLTKTRKMILLK